MMVNIVILIVQFHGSCIGCVSLDSFMFDIIVNWWKYFNERGFE